MGESVGAVLAQRGIDHIEIGQQLRRVCVALSFADRRIPGHPPDEVARRGREASMHAPKRLAIGLVEPVRRTVAGGVGQLQERRSDGDKARRHRELLGEMPQLVEVMAERQACLLLKRIDQHIGGHEGVAIAVAADP